MIETLNAVLASSRRYLKLDLKYKFELSVNATLLISNIISFGLLGSFVISSNPELVDYPYHVFLLSGIYYWAALSTGFSVSIHTLREEMEKGTIGFLLANGISPAIVILSRMIVSTVENVAIATTISIPAILVSSGFRWPLLPSSPTWLIELAACLILPWLFLYSVAVMLVAAELVFKRIGGLAGTIQHALGLFSGLYFPHQIIPLIGPILGYLPTTIGLSSFRKLLIYGEAREIEISIFRILTPFTHEFMLVIMPIVFLASSFILLSKVQRLTMRWGTIEQY